MDPACYLTSYAGNALDAANAAADAALLATPSQSEVLRALERVLVKSEQVSRARRRRQHAPLSC